MLSKMLKNMNRCDLKIICFEPNLNHCNKIKYAKEKFDLNIDIINHVISNKNHTLFMKRMKEQEQCMTLVIQVQLSMKQ